MDENKIDQLIQALEAVVQKVDELSERMDEMDSVVYDGLIGPANDAIAQNEYDNALSDFRTKYSEKLSSFEKPLKAIEGEDFDVFKNAFDAYNNGDYQFSPDEYVDKLTVSLTEQIGKIKEAVAEEAGVDPEDVDVQVDAKDGEDGTPEVQVDVDDKTTEEKPEDNVEEVSEEGKSVSTEEEPKPSEETKDESGEESLEDFEESLKKEVDKDKESWIRR